MGKFKLDLNDVVLALIGFLLFLAFNNCARADDRPIQLDNVDLRYDKFFDNGYTPMLPKGYHLNSGLDLNLDTTVEHYFFFNNRLNTLSDDHQFRLIGWEFKVGMRLFDWLDASYHHWSQHQLDIPNSSQLLGEKYPVQDSIQIRFILFSKEHKESIF